MLFLFLFKIHLFVVLWKLESKPVCIFIPENIKKRVVCENDNNHLGLPIYSGRPNAAAINDYAKLTKMNLTCRTDIRECAFVVKLSE